MIPNAAETHQDGICTYPWACAPVGAAQSLRQWEKIGFWLWRVRFEPRIMLTATYIRRPLYAAATFAFELQLVAAPRARPGPAALAALD